MAHAYPTIGSPLRVCPDNPRYFSGSDGVALLLTGSHTWNGLVDMGPRGAVVPFDWDAYLGFLEEHGHNFARLWAYDSLATWNPVDEVVHAPWRRTGPGTALDGRPKLDLTQLDPDYFGRLRGRVASAQDRGIYVSVMLFDSWSNFDQTETPVEWHMFADANNVNGIDITTKRSGGSHPGWSGMADPAVLAIQERYVREVVQTVADLDNVLFEISNEAGPESHAWQEHLTRHIRTIESEMGKQHPVGQTGGLGTSNEHLRTCAADYVAPGCISAERHAEGYRTGHYTYGSGPADAGDRPVILDTDHLWGVGGDITWCWKSFCRGYNLIYMDPWNDQPAGFFVHPRWPDPADPAVRREMGAIRDLSMTIDLAASVIAGHAASSGYCLSVPGRDHVIFQPGTEALSVELTAGRWSVDWRDPRSGTVLAGEPWLVPQAGTWELQTPFGGPSVIHLRAIEG